MWFCWLNFAGLHFARYCFSCSVISIILLTSEQFFKLSFSVHVRLFPFEFYFLISPHFVSFKKIWSILSKTNASQHCPAPKKRPMIFGWKIKSAHFYLLSKGYQILSENDFLLFQFRFKLKISTLEILSSDGSQIRLK